MALKIMTGQAKVTINTFFCGIVDFQKKLIELGIQNLYNSYGKYIRFA